MEKNDQIVPDFNNQKDPSIRIKLDVIDDLKSFLILNLSGYIDFYNASNFQDRVKIAINYGYKFLIFDCEKITYVASAGIGSFIEFLNILKEKNGGISLINVSENVISIIRTLGFDRFLNLRNNLKEAIHVLTTRKKPLPVPFPKVFKCPICGQKLKVTKPSKFTCFDCHTVFEFNDAGKLFLP